MVGDHDTGYLAALSADQRATLKRVNAPGLAALRGYLESGEAVAFLGAGASAPLYPLWAGLIGDLVDAAAARMDETEAATCRALALTAPEEAVEIVRRRLGGPSYHAVLREVLRVRTGPDTGRAFGGAELPVLYARRPECAPDRGKRVGRDWQDCPRHPLGFRRRAGSRDGRGCAGGSGGASTPTPPPSAGQMRS